MSVGNLCDKGRTYSVLRTSILELDHLDIHKRVTLTRASVLHPSLGARLSRNRQHDLSW